MAFMVCAIIGFVGTMSSVYIGAIGLEGKDQFIILRGDEQAYARMEQAPAIWERMTPEDKAMTPKQRLETDRVNLMPMLFEAAIQFGLFGLAGYAGFFFARKRFVKSTNQAPRITASLAIAGALLAVSVSYPVAHAQSAPQSQSASQSSVGGITCDTPDDDVNSLPPQAASKDVSAAKKNLWKGTVRTGALVNKSKRTNDAKALLSQPEVLDFIKKVHKNISGNWHPVKGSQPVEIAFKIAPDGSLIYARMEKSSGIDACDKAAMDAMHNAAPFPPIPQGVEMFDSFVFGFDKNKADHDGHGLTTMRGKFAPPQD